MKFGIAVTSGASPAVTPSTQADYVARVATAAEDAGYHAVWVADRTVYPHDIMRRYPHMFGPHHSKPDSQNLLEAVSVLSYLAGVTKRVRLGFAVLVLPFRNPVLNAKSVTTIDALSGGRVVFGVGAGWMREEFEGVFARMETRGSVTDEHIELFKAACTQDVLGYRGKHFQVSGKVFFPKPIQKPHPPVWVGGKTEAALRRAARLGDGWNGIFLTPEELATKRRELEGYCKEYKRGTAKLDVALTVNLHWGERKQAPGGGGRLFLTGSTEDILGDLRRYQDAGLDHLIVSVSADSTADTLARVRRLADELLPKV